MDENYGDKGFCLSPYLISISNITKYLIRLWRSETTTHFDHPKIMLAYLKSVFQPIAFFVSPNIFLRNQDSLFLFMRHVEPKKAFSKFIFRQTLTLTWKLWLWIEILWRAKKSFSKFNFWSHWRLFLNLKISSVIKTVATFYQKRSNKFFFVLLGF